MWPFGRNADKIRNHAFDEFSKGLECFGAKNREQALKHFRRAIKIKPDEGVFHMRIAATLEALGKIEEAKSEYEKAINLMPGSGEPYFLLGNMQRDQGKLIYAANNYEKALRLNLEPPFDEMCKKALISLQPEKEKNENMETELKEIKSNLLKLIETIYKKLNSFSEFEIRMELYSLSSPIDKELQRFMKEEIIPFYELSIINLKRLLPDNDIISGLKKIKYKPQNMNSLQYTTSKINDIVAAVNFVIIPIIKP
jgi:tetratricopeptide (TPR) repeat protein